VFNLSIHFCLKVQLLFSNFCFVSWDDNRKCDWFCLASVKKGCLSSLQASLVGLIVNTLLLIFSAIQLRKFASAKERKKSNMYPIGNAYKIWTICKKVGVISPSGSSFDAKSQLALKMPLLKDWDDGARSFFLLNSFVKMSVSRGRIKKTNEKLWRFRHSCRSLKDSSTKVSFFGKKKNNEPPFLFLRDLSSSLSQGRQERILVNVCF